MINLLLEKFNQSLGIIIIIFGFILLLIFALIYRRKWRKAEYDLLYLILILNQILEQLDELDMPIVFDNKVEDFINRIFPQDDDNE